MGIINNFMIAWFYLGIFGVATLPFRSDWIAVQIDLKRLFFSSILHFIISSIIGYIFMPFILIDNIINIFKNNV